MLKRVLIVNKSFCSAGLEVMKDKVQTTVIPYMDWEPESLPTIKKSVSGYDAIIWNTKHKLTKEILDLAGPQLKVVSTMSSGTDQTDTEEIKKRGIRLGNTTKVLDNAVADITVALMITAARRFKEAVEELESGQWKYGVQWMLGQDVSGSTVGIVGFGGIGQAVLRRLRGFDVARFLYSGRTDKPEEIVDQEALYVALKEKQIFAAGLDVVTPEPLPKEHPLLSLPNCYVVPHLGSATIKTRNEMATIAAHNVLLALEGKPMLSPIC